MLQDVTLHDVTYKDIMGVPMVAMELHLRHILFGSKMMAVWGFMKTSTPIWAGLQSLTATRQG